MPTAARSADKPILWQPGDPCDWRRKGEKRWKKSYVLGVLSDKDNSIRVWDKRAGFPACVPNNPANIRRRITSCATTKKRYSGSRST